MNSYLKALRETLEFQDLIKQIKKLEPVVPEWTPTEDNTDEWKSKSMMLKGFNLCLTYLGEKNV